MSNQGNQVKIQVRIGRCQLKSIAAPTQCSFTLKKDRVISSHSPWKHVNDNTIIFNSFLRIKVEDYVQNSKCSLSLYSRSEDSTTLLGQATISLSQSKSGKVRKYPIKNDGAVVAIVDANIYLFYFDHSLPLFQNNMSQIASYLHYSANSQYETSLEHILRREQTSLEKEKMKGQSKHQKLSINNQINLVIKQQPNIAENLFATLFQEIGKKDQEINKRKAELHQKDSLFEHIKVKQMIYQNQTKLINRLKGDARVLIAANEDLIHNDDKYDEEYYRMKEQKQQMQSQMAVMNSQASLKLMCLKSQLQNTHKQLNKKQAKIKVIMNQIENNAKILNNLKHENKQKSKIIQNIKSEFKNQHTKTQTKQDKKGSINIFDIFTKQIDQKNLQNEENIELLPSDLQQQNKMAKISDCGQLKRCKTLSIVRPSNFKDNKSPTKEKFRGSKGDIQSKEIPFPSIIEYIMNLGQNRKDKI